jgi:hypothetical protein
MRTAVVLVVVAVSVGTAVGARDTGSSGSAATLLETALGFTPAQVAAVERGDIVAVTLPGSVDREIAVAGAVRIAAPPERLVDVVRDVERLESGPGFLQTRRLGTPPTLDDFAALRLPPGDIKALRSCRPGRCEVKLGQGALDLLGRIDWRAKGADDAVNALARQVSLEYVLAYQQGGNEALAVYRDTDRPQFIALEFDDMVRRTPMIAGTLPALARDLVEYPNAPREPGAEDVFYWSLAEFGLKPVLRLNHVVIHRGAGSGPVRYAVATKQLYASHYFHTALELRVVADDPERAGRSHYLLSLNVARSDGLTGLFGGLVKSKARSGSRAGLEKTLAATRAICERR